MVQSLAHSGGNMTGIAYMGVELIGYRLQLLKESIPKLARIGVLVQKDHPLRNLMVAETQGAARKLKLAPQFFEFMPDDSPDKIDAAYTAMSRNGTQAVLGLPGGIFGRERKRITGLALKYRLPGTFDEGETIDGGAMMTYNPDSRDNERQIAGYIDKILRGAKPGDLPVQQPTKFKLEINLRIAKSMGLTIPQSVLLRAERVIE